MEPYRIRMGIPEMELMWNDLLNRRKLDELQGDERVLFDLLVIAIKHLSIDPKHPGLKSHEIEALSKKYQLKIWQSYLEQGKSARRIFWTYGPNRREITIIGIEPHPEDKKRGAYHRVKLSELP